MAMCARLQLFTRQVFGTLMQRLHDAALRSGAVAAGAQGQHVLLQGLPFGQPFADMRYGGFEWRFGGGAVGWGAVEEATGGKVGCGMTEAIVVGPAVGCGVGVAEQAPTTRAVRTTTSSRWWNAGQKRGALNGSKGRDAEFLLRGGSRCVWEFNWKTVTGEVRSTGTIKASALQEAIKRQSS